MALRDYVLSVKIAAWIGTVGVVLIIGVLLALRQLSVLQAHLPAQSSGGADTVRLTLLCAVALCVVLLVAVAYGIISNISRPLHSAASFAQQVAGGDLTASIKSTRTDEMGWLYYELGNMAKRLRETASEVHNSAQVLSTSADNIRSVTDQRTDAQAATLEQSVAAIRQLSDAVKQNAQQAAQAGSVASGIGSATAKSSAVVERVVGSMQAISSSSKKIEDIIGVIDGITFQTNILALNAAVEAARAGEQGKGFGVVAAEVRNLAQRSAQASKEIKALIQQSSAQVKAGGEFVVEAAKALRETMDGIQSVEGLARSIQATSGEQINAVGQLDQALAQIEQVTREKLAVAQETEAGVKSVQDEARRLVGLVAKFKVDSGAARAAQPQIVLTASKEVVAPPKVSQARPALAVKRESETATAEEWAEF